MRQTPQHASAKSNNYQKVALCAVVCVSEGAASVLNQFQPFIEQPQPKFATLII